MFLFIILYIVNVCFFEWYVLYFLLTPIFKKLDAFIPALSLLGTYIFQHLFLFCLLPKQNKRCRKMYQPLCVSFCYIIYIVDVCFLCKIFHGYVDANFQKAGRLHSCLIPARWLLFCVVFFVLLQKQHKRVRELYQPLCVSFYYIIVLVTTCIPPKIIFHPPKNRP